jgi:hypothetical protein
LHEFSLLRHRSKASYLPAMESWLSSLWSSSGFVWSFPPLVILFFSFSSPS